ncbi:DinB family protein [Mucilaginibacter sp.]|uniref:DinB family protein n=1 Tax=Mucilaginibacter sp. TaxID=1882438 RepID=UPI0035BC7D09
MKKISLVTLMVMLFAGVSAFAQITKDQAVAEWTRAKAYTKAYLDAMPADGYSFKATPEVRTFAGQMLHLADANYFFVGTASGKESPLGKNVSLEKTVAQTKDATTKAVLDSYDFAIAAIQGMKDAQLGEMVAVGDKIKATKGQMLAKGFEHQTHHRGQTTIYIRLKGAIPPNEMLF